MFKLIGHEGIGLKVELDGLGVWWFDIGEMIFLKEVIVKLISDWFLN